MRTTAPAKLFALALAAAPVALLAAALVDWPELGGDAQAAASDDDGPAPYFSGDATWAHVLREEDPR